jgi:uncharacterized protein YggU (UPF0235/DUF167 family)
VALPSYIGERGGSARISVRVTPGAAADAIVGPRENWLVVRVRARAVEGKANESLRRLIAKACGVGAGRVRIVHGHGGRRKLLQVEGLGAGDAARLLEAARRSASNASRQSSEQK